MQHARDRADDALPRQRRRLHHPRGASAAAGALVERARQRGEHLRATRQHPRPGAQRLHEQQLPQLRARVESLQQHLETSAHARLPTLLPVIGPDHIHGEVLDRAIEHRQEAVLAVLEQVIERAPRHPRADRHPRDAHLRVAVLRDDLRRRAEHARALHLAHRHASLARAGPGRDQGGCGAPGDHAAPPGARQWTPRPHELMHRQPLISRPGPSPKSPTAKALEIRSRGKDPNPICSYRTVLTELPTRQ